MPKANELNPGEAHAGGASSDSGSDADASQLDPAAIRAALERVLQSPDFAASDRIRRFLRYVVEEALAGRADRIKAFTVAMEVFGRDASFDAQNDPVVRIEAGRLRRSLEHYYQLSGKEDPVAIHIPKGGYVPVFTVRALPDPVPDTVPSPGTSLPVGPGAAVTGRRGSRRGWWLAVPVVLVLLAAVAWVAGGRPMPGGAAGVDGNAVPRMLVLRFENLGDGELPALYAAALTDEIITALGRFKDVEVLSAETSRALGNPPSPEKVEDTLGVQYLVEGSVRSLDDRLRVSVRLTDSSNGTVLWSNAFESPVTPQALAALPEKTASAVAAAVAQPYGAVFQAQAQRAAAAPPEDIGAYLCTLRYYAYRTAISPENYAVARDCLERTVKAYPGYATAWALLAHIYVDEIRTGFARSINDPPTDRALAAARTAVGLDPNNARALQALAVALFFDHQVDEAFRVSDRAIAANPNDSELLGQLGQLVGLAGRMDAGRALIERALTLNPENSAFYRGVLAIIAYMQHDFATARREIASITMDSLPIFHGVAAIVYAQSGETAKARAELATFERMAPDFIPNLWAELDRRNIPEASQDLIAEGLAKLGATIPPKESSGGRAPGQMALGGD